MRFCLMLAAEIFLAAMAVFGIYCALFLMSENGREWYSIAIRIQNKNDIKNLEGIILQAGTSLFSSCREKYALLVDYDLDEDSLKYISDNLSVRVDVYRRIVYKD